MITAFFLTFLALICLIRPAIKIKLIDHPNELRKHHHRATPLVGGIGMLFGMIIGWLLITLPLSPYRVLFIAFVVSSFFGVLDDLHELSHRARFFVQIFVAVIIVCFGKNCILSVGNLFFLGSIKFGAGGILFTIIAIVGVINAVNMSDGIDGLAGSQSFVELALLALLAFLNHLMLDYYFLIVALASIFAFLCFNFPFNHRKAKVFMGDVGSSLLAILLVWFLIKFTQAPTAIIKPAAALWIVALPLFDIASVIYRRLKQKKSPFHGDREHLHHILLKAKLKPLYVTVLLTAVTFLLGVVGLLLSAYHVPDGIIFFAFIGLFLMYLFVVNHALDTVSYLTKVKKRIYK